MTPSRNLVAIATLSTYQYNFNCCVSAERCYWGDIMRATVVLVALCTIAISSPSLAYRSGKSQTWNTCKSQADAQYKGKYFQDVKQRQALKRAFIKDCEKKG